MAHECWMGLFAHHLNFSVELGFLPIVKERGFAPSELEKA